MSFKPCSTTKQNTQLVRELLLRSLREIKSNQVVLKALIFIITTNFLVPKQYNSIFMMLSSMVRVLTNMIIKELEHNIIRDVKVIQ